MEPYEAAGRLYCENQRLLGEYQKLLELTQRLATGELQPSQVEIDMPNLKWAIVLGPGEV